MHARRGASENAIAAFLAAEIPEFRGARISGRGELGRRIRPLGQRDRFRRTIVDDKDRRDGICLLEARRKSRRQSLLTLTINWDNDIDRHSPTTVDHLKIPSTVRASRKGKNGLISLLLPTFRKAKPSEAQKTPENSKRKASTL